MASNPDGKRAFAQKYPLIFCTFIFFRPFVQKSLKMMKFRLFKALKFGFNKFYDLNF